MTPEVLIVGDPIGRRGFAEEVEALGYAVSLCEPRELNRRVRTTNPPTAIVACIGDVDPDVLLAGLRRTRAGAGIPVLLYGRLGGSLRDLADVLDIGADHFLEESLSPGELADALSQYAGAPRPRESRGRAGVPERAARSSEPESAVSRRLPTEPRPSRSPMSTATRPGRAAEPSNPRGREPVLGDLHRTLDRLEARLRGREDSDPELASLGLESIPDVEPEEGELEDDEPLVTDIGVHLRGRGGDGYDPSSSVDYGRRPSAGEFEERSRARSVERRPATRPESTERLGERAERERVPERAAERERVPVPRPRPGSDEGTSRALPRPSVDERAAPREATGRWGRAPEPSRAAEPSRVAEPSRAPESTRGSAVLMGRRPDRPARPVPQPPASSRSPELDERSEPWPRTRPSPLHREPERALEDADDEDDDEDTGRVRSRESETATRALREDRDRDRGPLRVGPPSREREREDRERATLRLDAPRPLRKEQPPWQDPAPVRVEPSVRAEPRPVREPEPRPRASASPSAVSLGTPQGGARSRIETNVPEAGKLGTDVDVPGLLWQLHRQRFTGRLRLHRQRIEKQLWLQDGELVFARSNATSDRLIDGLLRRGVLTRPQYETARQLAAKEPRRAGHLLVDAGFLKLRELETLLRDHLARVIDSTFAWSDGSFSTEPGERSDEPIQLDLAMPVVLLDGIRHRFEPSDLEQALRAAAGSAGQGPLLPRVRESLGRDHEERVAVAAEQLRLPPEEERLLARFDGRQAVPTLLAEGIDDLGLFALLRVSSLAGVVEFVHASEPAIPAEPASEEGRPPDQVDSDRILERLRLAREGDYFELLGLARDAARSEIRQAHAELLSTFGDDALEPETRSRHRREIRELRSAIDEALDILADDAMRSAYLAHLQEPD